MKAFELKDKVAVVMGGGGILGTDISIGLSEAGAAVAVCDLREENAIRTAESLKTNSKGYMVDAMAPDSVKSLREEIMADFGKIDILVNAVGGNMKAATTNSEYTFFELDGDAIKKVVELNLIAGAVTPSQIFGRDIASNEDGGVIINISSMNYYRPLTRTPGYSAAKAAVSNFTQWLAVDLAMNFSDKIRVNAIAPGFFLTDQNRYLLINEKDGALTERGKQIIAHTPAGRFGSPDDLTGTLVWLASDASRFVTGITVPVDGGFSAYSGV